MERLRSKLNYKGVFRNILILFVLQSCIKFNGDVDKKYRDILEIYKQNDTLKFNNINNITEQFIICGVDSLEVRQGLSNLPFKSITLYAVKLNEKDTFSFINLLKEQSSNDIFFDLNISFPTFSGNINPDKKRDTIENILNLNKEGNQSSIKQILWSNESGVLKFEKSNGAVFVRK